MKEEDRKCKVCGEYTVTEIRTFQEIGSKGRTISTLPNNHVCFQSNGENLKIYKHRSTDNIDKDGDE